MNRNPVGWFEIYVNDMERARAFYEAVFATTLEQIEMPELEMWSFAMGGDDMPGSSGALIRMEGHEAGGNSTIIYFSCEDCAVEEARVEPNGGKIFKSKFSIGDYGFVSLVYDTEGNMIGLHSMA
jgi:Predicted enzyme related to lactoylglutathione lyase